ncbi:unnamed protein product [Cyprideis torosa]|uniref:Zinc finger protein 830 n=1 Tax=Cyprideis torosa TaxID=163714 RepID=A0A7R8ZQ88_9CRUS|nr:unnamed protein product [Cyprideis torosa]CAG0895719.1 unnamed protein product [Cyprideis torosa]
MSSKTRLQRGLKQIDSPLAKYNETGQLSCVVCNIPVKSELVWTAHINGKFHRETVAKLKARQQGTPAGNAPESTAKAMKRKEQPPPVTSPPKKPKSILKNPLPLKVVEEPQKLPTSKENPTEKEKGSISELEAKRNVKPVSASSVPQSSAIVNQEGEGEMDEPKVVEGLPEGFFDNPVLDAKARKVEYVDPLDEEYAQFQKEISEVAVASRQLVEEDDAEETVERELDEVEEQMKNWSR